jgi:hypothetical protein
MCWQLRASGYSYPRVTVIQIDIHPAGKTLSIRHVRFPRTVHVCDKYASCRQSTYVATFCAVINGIGQRHCSREKMFSTPSPSSAEWSMGPTQFLSSTSQWSRWGKAKYPLTTGYIGLLGPYLQHATSMFNTCSAEPTQTGATTLEVSTIHITLPALPNRGSSTFP